MTRQEIDRFFRVLAREYPGRATIILTGAAAGTLWGGARPSRDIDFAIRPMPRTPRTWTAVDAAIQRTIRMTGISANYAEDIDRWGLITLLDYPRHTRLHKRYGRLTVRVLEPAYWAIGKLTRYLAPDVQDVVTILTRHRPSAEAVVRIWGRALRHSPRSTSCELFRRQVEHFVRTRGRRIWGRRFDADVAIEQFRRAARTY